MHLGFCNPRRIQIAPNTSLYNILYIVLAGGDYKLGENKQQIYK